MSADLNGRYGDAIPRSFGLTRSPRLATRSLSSSQVVAHRLELGPEQFGLSPGVPPEDTHIVAIYTTPVEDHELLSRGRTFVRRGYAQGAMRIVNLTGEFSARIMAPHESVVLYLPHRALDGFTEDAGLASVSTLSCEPGLVDPTMHGLARALLPAFQRPGEASQLFVDHVVLAACSHLTSRYAEPIRTALSRGGLSPRQQARAQDYIGAHFAENITLTDLARHVDLSRSHFARAFKATTGLAPYQWLIRFRFERAKAMMVGSDLNLEQIAVACGFADQAHLSRVFRRMTKTSPGAWRRHR